MRKLFLWLLLYMLPALCWAHKPQFDYEPGITKIDNSIVSLAFYREMAAPYVHLYEIPAERNTRFHVGLLLPAIEGQHDYQLWLAIMGPGLDPEGLNQLPELAGLLPTAIPNGWGATIVPPAVTEEFFEKFTRTLYWGRQSWDGTLPVSSNYYLVVWQSEQRGGKYVMDTGYQERFGVWDILRMPKWLYQTRRFFKVAQ